MASWNRSRDNIPENTILFSLQWDIETEYLDIV